MPCPGLDLDLDSCGAVVGGLGCVGCKDGLGGEDGGFFVGLVGGVCGIGIGSGG